jgi:murein DD-endopeptidase MepM/ murein hydrolase activator NlpD
MLHPLRSIALVLKILLRHPRILGPKKTNDLRHALGNHIILKMPGKEIYGFFAHARTGSLRVQEGEEVHLGQHIADVGHSGNSTAPHLHFHLMDSANILEAQGVHCCFKKYETFRHGEWGAVTDGIPGMREFIRYAA